MTRRLGEKLVQKYWADEEERERKSQPKKPKKGFLQPERDSAVRDSFEEDEWERRRRRKEKKAQDWEAELRAERERKEREEDRHLAQEKLLNQFWKEKYSHDCPELKAYRKKHITVEQMESISLDDHTAYLTCI